MTLDQMIDWGIRAVMGLATVFVFLLGRDQQRLETILTLRFQALVSAEDLKRMEAERRTKHDLRNEIHALMGAQEIAIATRFDRAGQRSSDAADLAQALEVRIVRLETLVTGIGRAGA